MIPTWLPKQQTTITVKFEIERIIEKMTIDAWEGMSGASADTPGVGLEITAKR